MRQDVRYALRLMRRAPMFSSLLIGTLSLGMASAIAIFTLCDKVLFKPLPYPQPDRVVSLNGVGFGRANDHPAVPTWLETSPVFAGVGFYGSGGLNLGDGSRPQRIRAGGVSAAFFQAMGTPPLRGRTFTSAEEIAADHVVVLGYDLWRARFSADPAAIGRAIRLNDQPYIVVGVMPEGFAFPDDAEVWLPAFAEDQIYGNAISATYVARLAPHASLDDARRAIDRVNADRKLSRPAAAGRPADVVPLRDRLVDPVRPTLLFLAGIVSLLLVATCANVAGLLLARLQAREPEWHLRSALGAGRWRLAVQLLIECLVITSLGVVGGVGGAVLALRAIIAAAPDVSPVTDVLAVDMRFVAVCVGAGLVTGALFAIAPMLAVGRRATAHVLREGVTHSARMSWTRSGLVAGQVASALVLLTATSAALAVVARLARIEVGFENDRAAVFEVTLPSTKYKDAAARIRVAKAVDDAVRALPGITAAGVANVAPATHELAVGRRFLRERDDILAPVQPSQVGFEVAATPGYFRALGIQVLAGRTFLANEDETSSRVVVMSERAARGLWGSPTAAVGQRLKVIAYAAGKPQPIYDVVGVVSDVRMRGVSGSPELQIYVPYATAPSYSGVAVAVSSVGEPAALAPLVQRAIATVDPDLPVYNPILVRDLRARYLAKERLTLELTGAFGLITLVLCGIGLYGCLTQIVGQRTKEIGIRLALGAEPRRLLRGVLRQGLGVALAGVLAGSLLSTAAVRAIARFVPTLDAPSARAVALDAAVLLVIAVVAAWLPARRAARVDPLTALRSL